MKIQQKKENRSTGINVHPHFPFLVEDIQLLILFSLFSFYHFPPTSSTPFRPHVHWVRKEQNCRLLQEIFNKGVTQPWRDYLERCKMSLKVRWDSHKPLSSPVAAAAAARCSQMSPTRGSQVPSSRDRQRTSAVTNLASEQSIQGL